MLDLDAIVVVGVMGTVWEDNLLCGECLGTCLGYWGEGMDVLKVGKIC